MKYDELELKLKQLLTELKLTEPNYAPLIAISFATGNRKSRSNSVYLSVDDITDIKIL